MDPQQRIQQLTQRLHYLNNQYYQHDISEVSDQEFDAMLAELNQLEKAYPDLALANSHVYLEAAGHVVVAWLWLEQALATGNGTEAFYHGKRAAARYFWRWELPRTRAQFDLLESLDRTVLDTDDAWL